MSQHEHDSYIGIIRNKKKNVFYITLVIAGIFLAATCISIFAIFFEDVKFANCDRPNPMYIEDLSEGSVKDYPYVQIQGGCTSDNVLYFSKGSDKEYYYLIQSCDSVSATENKVIIKTDEGLYDKLMDGDSTEAVSRFFTGKLTYGMVKGDEESSFIRNSWLINSENVYVLIADYTPEDEWKGDLLAIAMVWGAAALISVFVFMQRKAAIKELDAWQDLVNNKYPNGVIM